MTELTAEKHSIRYRVWSLMYITVSNDKSYTRVKNIEKVTFYRKAQKQSKKLSIIGI